MSHKMIQTTLQTIDEGLIDLGSKHPVESIQVKLLVSGKIPDGEILYTPPTAYMVDKDVPTVNLPGMFSATPTAFNEDERSISVWFKGGTQGKKYKCIGFFDVQSGQRHWFGFSFKVIDLGLALPPSISGTTVTTTQPQSSVAIIPFANTPIDVIFITDYANGSEYEVAILRCWSSIDETISAPLPSVIDKTASGFKLSSQVDAVKVFWKSEKLTQ